MPNTTFIIPIKIDSPERYNNILITINYLLKHTNSFIFIKEVSNQQRLNFNDSRIHYKFVNDENFHRTKIINEMLSEVETPVVSNYDADVVLPIRAYKLAEHMILNQSYDLVYPYGFECMDQRIIRSDNAGYEQFKNNLDLSYLKFDQSCVSWCRYGHVQFFKTKSYIEGFMENENYYHWCPEDEERGVRFKKLDYRVEWFRSLVYHQQHPPSIITEPLNKQEIIRLHQKLMTCSKDELIGYYREQDYYKKYWRKND